MAAAGGPDPLFGLRNNFYLGAYQAAINNSDVPNLSTEDAIERDSIVYRSYIALGSYQVIYYFSFVFFFFIFLTTVFFYSVYGFCFFWCLCDVQLVINEIDDSAATPLQAVKLLAMYLANPSNKVVFSSFSCFDSGGRAIDTVRDLLVSCTLCNAFLVIRLWEF